MFSMPQPQRFTGNPSTAMLGCLNPQSTEIQLQTPLCRKRRQDGGATNFSVASFVPPASSRPGSSQLESDWVGVTGSPSTAIRPLKPAAGRPSLNWQLIATGRE